MTLIATLVCAVGILGLFVLDRDRKSRTSPALWISVMWFSIGSSRMVSGWFSGSLGGGPSNAADAYLEGSPMDRNILTGLLVLGIIVLIGRRSRVLTLLRANVPILMFYSYCLISIVWSGFPDVAFKRWTKFLADLVMVLIVLTDADRSSAIKRFLARTAFVLVPTSILLIKYYPDLGRSYGRFEGTLFFTGVATDKNMLGKFCLLLGLATVWRLRQILSGAEGTRRTRHLVAHLVILGMVLWLLLNANSMTSLSVFALGSGLIVATGVPALARRRWTVHVLVVAALAIAFFALFLNIGAGLVQTLGRDPTLTGRTELWAQVLRMNRDPILGTGFESFWLGSRLERLWSIYWWHPNQAHNGYIEVFLNLGGVGIALLGIVIATGYRNIVRGFRWDPDTGRLRLVYFVAGVAYNFTEANFKILSPVWITFLLATIAVPKIPLVGRTLVRNPAAEPDTVETLEEVV
jgi:exopolysaccharide production protein ExoQ